MNIGISIKCGIHIVGVLFCLLETNFRNQIILIGLNVNFANRLEGVADNDELLISEETIKSVREKFAFKSFDRDIYLYGEVKADQIISKLEVSNSNSSTIV